MLVFAFVRVSVAPACCKQQAFPLAFSFATYLDENKAAQVSTPIFTRGSSFHFVPQNLL